MGPSCLSSAHCCICSASYTPYSCCRSVCACERVQRGRGSSVAMCFLCISNQIVYFYSWTILEQLCMIHSIFYNGPSSTLLLAPPPLKVSFFWFSAPSKQKGSEHCRDNHIQRIWSYRRHTEPKVEKKTSFFLVTSPWPNDLKVHLWHKIKNSKLNCRSLNMLL